MRRTLLDFFSQVYDWEAWQGLLGGALYMCHNTSLKFIQAMDRIQDNHYKDFNMRDYKKKLLDDVNRATEMFRYRQAFVIKNLGEKVELQGKLWNTLKNEVKFKQS